MTANEVVVSRLKIEHLRETLGVGVPSPRLSWQVITEAQNWRQAAYEIACFDGEGALLEETGRIDSDQSVLLPWPFAPLKSRQQVSLKARVWGDD
ncbi:MAG: hypothetical protein KDE34_28710, partial [Anaerolineales bacterium]|nr:hypothetical protein [Anaerolineales bacterium]